MSSISFGKIFATVDRNKPNQEKIIKSIPQKVPGTTVELLYRSSVFDEDNYTITAPTKEIEEKLIARLNYGYKIKAIMAPEAPKIKEPTEFSWFA